MNWLMLKSNYLWIICTSSDNFLKGIYVRLKGRKYLLFIYRAVENISLVFT